MIKDVASKSSENAQKKTVKNIGLELIDMNEDNNAIFSCDDLSVLKETIKRNGFQGSVEVYLKKDGRYGLLSGHRRFLSCKELGFLTIPCEIVEEPSESKKAEILIMSNMASRELTPIEKGCALRYYEENVLNKEHFKGDKRAELARRFGTSSSQVYKLKALCDLVDELKQLITNEVVAYAYIYECAKMPSDTQKRIAKDIIYANEAKGTLSARDISYIISAHTGKEIKEEKKEEYVARSESITENQVNDIQDDNSLLLVPTSFEKEVFVEADAPAKNKRMSYEEQRILRSAMNLYSLLESCKKIESEEVKETLDKLKNLI